MSFPRPQLFMVLLLTIVVCACMKRDITHTGNLPRSSSASNQQIPNSRININTASTEDLEALPGIGKVLAARIVEHRKKYGPFRRAEHLIMVRGFSDRRFRALQTMITVE